MINTVQGKTIRASEWAHDTCRWADSAPVEGPDHDIYLSSFQHRVSRLDSQTGQVVWSADVGDQLHAPPQLSGDRLLVQSNGVEKGAQDDGPLPRIIPRNQLIALDRADGSPSWTLRLNDLGQTWTSPDGTVYAVDSEQRFSALDPATGTARWTQPVSDPYNVQPQFGPDGALYMVQERGGQVTELVRLDPATGEKAWGFIGGNLQNAVQVGSESQLAVSSRKFDENYNMVANMLHVLEPATGKTLWTRDMGQAEYGLEIYGDKMLLSEQRQGETLSRWVSALDSATGELLWECSLPPGNLVPGRDGSLYTMTSKVTQDWSAYGHAFMRLDAESGKRLWTFEPQVASLAALGVPGDSRDFYLSGVRMDPDTGLGRGVLFAVDPETGRPRWEYETGRAPTEVIPTADGSKLFVKVGQCKVLCLDAETGMPDWNFRTGEQLEVSTTAEGTLLVTDLDGRVASLATGSSLAEPGDTPCGSEQPSGGPTVLRGYSTFPVVEGHTKVILGEERPVLSCDFDFNGTLEDWDYILVRDLNGDGVLTDADLAQLPDRPFLQSLDRDGNGLVVGSESQEARLFLWRDVDGDGRVSQEDFSMQAGEEGAFAIDLERMNLSTRFSSGCDC